MIYICTFIAPVVKNGNPRKEEAKENKIIVQIKIYQRYTNMMPNEAYNPIRHLNRNGKEKENNGDPK